MPMFWSKTVMSTTWPGCVVGYTIEVCVSALSDVHVMVRSLNEAFHRTYPQVETYDYLNSHCLDPETEAQTH